jgi:hypothetical protein
MKTRVAFVLLLALLCLSAMVVAAQDPDRNPTGFQFCIGRYALCAASTCTPTGKKIKVNGSNSMFEEADCNCPVLDGVSIADVKGGTMKGDCRPPSDNGVWSLYSIEMDIPQEIFEWMTEPTAFLECPANLNQGREQVNCFSFACDNIRMINGATVTTCHCAKGENPFAQHVPPATAFVTEAGQGDQSFCFKHPVAGSLKTQ